MTNHPINLIRSSMTLNRLKIRMDLTTVDINQQFLVMDEADYQSFSIKDSSIQIQGIMGQITDAVSIYISNNTFILAQTNYLLTVMPGCRSDIDFTRTSFQVLSNNFSQPTSTFVTYHLFIYNGFANITYDNNNLQNLLMKGYSHLVGQFVFCPNLMSNNTNIFFKATRNVFNFTLAAPDDARIDVQV